jgi:pimeloyl-ACP methyl ester carboxylesterase
MPSHSVLARLQQAISATLLLASLAWLLGWWRTSPLMAVSGVVIIMLGYSLFLAAEFVLLRATWSSDMPLRPTWGEVARAWLAETVTAPRVFSWRQPWRWRAEPDRDESAMADGRCGVVFIHGFFCNRGFWNPWMARLRAQGRCFAAVNLEPPFGSIDAYAPIIEEAVQRITRATGRPPVLVGHSMGGLAARAWLRTASHARVHRIVTIGSPHGGTWLARFSHMRNGRQMQLNGEWLDGLAGHEAGIDATVAAANFTCWYSNCDNIVFPVATATLKGADNRLVRGAAHVELAFVPRVVEETLALVARGDRDAVNSSQESRRDFTGRA